MGQRTAGACTVNSGTVIVHRAVTKIVAVPVVVVVPRIGPSSNVISVELGMVRVAAHVES